MRTRFLLAAAMTLAIAAPAMAQQQHNLPRSIPPTPMLKADLEARTDLKATAVLRNEIAKRQFVANELALDLSRIGLSEPLMLRPADGRLIIPNQAYVTLDGSVSIDPSQRKFRVERNGSFYLRLQPPPAERDMPYLVSVTVDLPSAAKMSTRATSGSRLDVGLENLPAGETTLNFVVQRFNGDTFLQLFGDRRWDLEKIEITPVRR